MEVLVKHATLNVPHCIFELIKKKYYVFLGTVDVNKFKYARQYEHSQKQKIIPGNVKDYSQKLILLFLHR